MIFAIGITLALLSWFVLKVSVIADIDLSKGGLAALSLTFICGVVLVLWSVLTLGWVFLP